MSLFTDASLVYVPSGVKNGKTYSITPTDGSGDLTFSRGSDIEATRIGADGLIQKAQVNLLLQSNQFDTTWTASNSTLTSGQAGYDGSNDAWLLTTNGVNGFENITQSINFTGVHTLSIYAKQGTNVYLEFRSLTSDFRIRYKLDDGTHTTQSGSPIDTFMDSVGGGWYRCGFTANFSGATAVVIYPQQVGVADAGNIYIQDAQLNYGLVAQTYQETTTAAVVSGITNDMPRLSYDPANPTCPSLLLEPSRQNLVPHSDYIGSLVAEKGTITSNADTSPEGVLNATSFVEDSTTGRHRTSFFVSVTSGQTYTFSMFAKIKSGTRLLCINNAATIGARAYFNLVSGAVQGVDSGTASIEDYGDGWFRCSVTAQSSITGTATTYFGLEDGTADNGYTGDGTSGHYWYGLQLEAGSYSSSLIPTYGSSATRTSESCSKTGIASLIGQSEGTLYWEGVRPEGGNDFSAFSLSDGTTNNEVFFRFTTEDRIEFYYRTGGTQPFAANTTAYNLNQNTKIAFAYKANDVAVYVNGNLISAGSPATTPTSLTQLKFERGNGTIPMIASVNQAIVFKTRLSNADLATLTTL